MNRAEYPEYTWARHPAVFQKSGNTIMRTETIGLQVTNEKRVFIVCFCGKKFDFAENRSVRVPKLSDCPNCNDSYQFEVKEKSYLLIRMRTGSCINVSKDSFN